ncbi:MAG: PIN domain-containing protein [Thermoleophilaceae bacterium]|nr:PIN domain-containing protein [Thermoleophilaceae bacterium]
MTGPVGVLEPPLVFDTSAWQRQRELAARRRWLELLDAGRLALCPVVALEVCAAARDDDEHARLEQALAALQAHAPVTEQAGEAARGALRDLGGRRRLPAADYLIAAAAAQRGFGVLHYDRHFDTLCDALGIQSVWLAPRGTLD